MIHANDHPVHTLSALLCGRSRLPCDGSQIRRIIRFHEAAAGKPWEDMEEPLRQVILTLTRTTGFGFLAVGLLLIATCAAAPGHPGAVLKYGSPCIALTYCLGIFWSTYRLHQATRTPTPWKGSLAAAALLLAAMAVSSVLG